MSALRFVVLCLLAISPLSGKEKSSRKPSPITITFEKRPGSRPYISGDTYRSIANHIFDEDNENFNPSMVEFGDTIFINLDRMEEFFSTKHPEIKSPYILISSNHDYPVPGPYASFLNDDKLLVWFSQNVGIADHPKVVPVPTGLSNRHWSHSRDHHKHIAKAQQGLAKDRSKPILFYGNIRINTNSAIRQPVYDFFIHKSFCTWSNLKPFPLYIWDLAQSKFVLSPHGNGLDCHRTWEALYMGSYPVVKKSTLDCLYEDLPVLIVDSWEDVSEEILERKYLEMSQKLYNYDKLYFDYWEKVILATQEKLRKGS